MIDRVGVWLLAGCAMLGGVIVVELAGDDAPANSAPAARPAEPGSPKRAPGPRVDELLATILGRPLFSPTRQPATRAAPDKPAGVDLGELRLTGIVTGPERRFAIFAVPGARPMVRGEGETVSDWHLDTISPQQVVLSGPAGTRTLQPKIDANLTRRPPSPPRPAVAPASTPPPAPPAALPPRPATTRTGIPPVPPTPARQGPAAARERR